MSLKYFKSQVTHNSPAPAGRRLGSAGRFPRRNPGREGSKEEGAFSRRCARGERGAGGRPQIRATTPNLSLPGSTGPASRSAAEGAPRRRSHLRRCLPPGSASAGPCQAPPLGLGQDSRAEPGPAALRPPPARPAPARCPPGCAPRRCPHRARRRPPPRTARPRRLRSQGPAYSPQTRPQPAPPGEGEEA